ncbi:Acetyltransferase (GNAT) family protein [Candidatus Izimaplasma bacterium HR1]|jgi:N-acetylglutamate synthase-like GNAT family acetyltransferase|uniref:GNAT family N-acetyltransferase n=1 Tax=Candidatus Izimoplasma sp. HR1 TaxID=1541959 RepID=UPI0004F6AEEE|nr:Acetyltransferase (GNAT) family protein [Candidatus Izimaplasma bacterium HR1]
MNIKVIENNDEKQKIASKILLNLPEWFGIEESTKEYVSNVIKYPFIAAYNNDEAIGFYSLREENKDVLEMYVLGILKKYHNQGIGTLLQEYVNKYARNKNYKYLMVLTLAEKVQNKEYLQTRNFYLKMNFIDFYQNDDIFDKFNPCQIMMKMI